LLCLRLCLLLLRRLLLLLLGRLHLTDAFGALTTCTPTKTAGVFVNVCCLCG
jgi:hypothetical protein